MSVCLSVNFEMYTEVYNVLDSLLYMQCHVVYFFRSIKKIEFYIEIPDNLMVKKLVLYILMSCEFYPEAPKFFEY
jgi:hypothetical protein